MKTRKYEKKYTKIRRRRHKNNNNNTRTKGDETVKRGDDENVKTL